jgi:acyl-CoA synthetase (AMP-forming)/AMP-acid ligase II
VPADREPPDPSDLYTALKPHLSAYKIPRRFLFLADADVPMLSSGKLDARALKERFRDA